MAKQILFLLSILVLSNTNAIAQNVTELNPNGTAATIKLSAKSRVPQTAYVISRGNESQYVSISIQAPVGTRVSAQSAVLGKEKPLDLIAKSSGWVSSSFVSSTGAESQTLSLGSSTQTRAVSNIAPVKLAASGALYCGHFTAAYLDQVIAALRSISTAIYTRNTICQIYGYSPGPAYDPNDGNFGVSPGDGSNNGGVTDNPPNNVSPSQAYVTSQIFVRKNTCEVKANGSYLVRVDLSFDNVSDESLAQDSEITIGAVPIVYRGSKASSIKPESDGKFAPRALFLMATTGGYSWTSGDVGTEKLNVVRWSRGSPSSRSLKVEDLVSWRGHQLARVIAEPVLRGGRGTVELQSRVGVYSVCFRLVKSRQRLNGYN